MARTALATTTGTALKLKLRGHELADLLDHAPPGVTTLSLDCFDTLLWRNTHAPRDVFAEVPLRGGGMMPRLWAENVSQRMNFLRTKSHEVSLEDIYRRLMTVAPPEEIEGAIAHELALEARHCFPFAPVVELMRRARARGLKIIIVSDMYLREAQLRDLLARAAGDEVVALIDRVFMSCEYGKPKGAGLFEPVLKAIGARPHEVIHVGDNIDADYRGAARHGIHAVHFVQFDEEAKRRLRLEMVAGVMIDPTTRVTIPSYQPHRAQISMRREDDIAYTVGHDVMGPVMHAMVTWMKRDIDALSERLGRPVRPLFMMRDGYLPMKVFQALYPDAGGAPIELSRLAATRAILSDDRALDEFVGEYLHVLTPKSLCRHLMLYEPEVARALKEGPGRDPRKELAKLVRQPDIRRKIFARSRAFTKRLMAHLRAAGVNDGDAVMLVDVGYKGTVQNMITPVLEREMGLHVSGRYLFLREETVSGLDKAGLLDTDYIETRAMHALATCVAVVEQMLNVAQGSTVDFADDGTPVRESYDLKASQNATRERIQQAAIDFATNAFAAMHRRPASDDIQARRRMASAILTRLLFLPMESEIALFRQFDHDNNLGSSSISKLLDDAEAQEGLRRRGLAYVSENRRMYVPAEIARHGLPLNLSLLTTSRFGLDIRNADFEVGGIEVPVILLDATEQTVIPMQAYPTHEGYYRLNVPVGLRRATVAIQLGTVCETVQIDTARWTPVHEFDVDRVVEREAATTIADAMDLLADGIYACRETGVLIVPPSANPGCAQVLGVIFRPLRWRGEAAEARAAA